MTDQPLSPAAAAVKCAAYTLPIGSGLRSRIAAALRALEDQLAQDRPGAMPPDLERAVLTERIRLFRRITAIAAELDNISPPS